MTSMDPDNLTTHSCSSPFAVENFQHRPLDLRKNSIRLIKILPDLSTDGLFVCEIWRTTIKSKYQCLSYRWGSQENAKSILIRDMEGKASKAKPWKVGSNLHDFLHAIRPLPDAADPFWIDAVCIDQENTTERNHQVKQMGKIYSRTLRVIVWLGICTERYALVANQNEPQRNEVDYKESLDMCSELSENGYWKRAWITQEVILPKHVDVLIHKNCFRLEVFIPSMGDQPATSRLQSLLQLREKHHREIRGSISLWPYPTLESEILEHTSRTECQTSRDRIYSVLTLMKGGDKLEVDYSMPAIMLVYHLLKLYKEILDFYDVVFALDLLREELDALRDLPQADSPFVEYRVFFDDYPKLSYRNQIVEYLLGTTDLGNQIEFKGDGFRITRNNRHSQLLTVRVSLLTIATLPLEEADRGFSENNSSDPRIRAEFEAWARSDISRYICSPIRLSEKGFSRSSWKAWRVFSGVMLGLGEVH